MSGMMEPDARSSMAAMDAASQASQATSAMNPFISFGYKVIPGVGAEQARMLAEQTGDFGLEGLMKTAAAASPVATNAALARLGRTDFSPALQMMSQQQAAPSGGGMRRGSFQPSANQLAALMEMRKRKPISLL